MLLSNKYNLEKYLIISIFVLFFISKIDVSNAKSACFNIKIVNYAKANTIVDPSFEQGTTIWTVQNNNGVGVYVENSVARTGSRSLKIISRENQEFSGFQRNIVGIVGDAEYVYSVWVKGDNVQGIGGGGKPVGWIQWRDNKGDVIRFGVGKNQRYIWADYGTYEWREFKMHLQAPPEAAGVDVGLRTWAHVTGGTSYWDDVSLSLRRFPNRGSLVATYQVSDATTRFNGTLKTVEAGYTGSDYFEPIKNSTRSYVEWENVSGGQGGGARIISFRYALEGWQKTWQIVVNGVNLGNVNPTQTGYNNSWASFDQEVNLSPGNNTIRVILPEYSSASHMPLLLDRVDLYLRSGGEISLPQPSNLRLE